MDCIFCKIVNKEIPSQLVFENEYMAAFRDLAPQAPVHILAVPKVHIASMNEITKENSHIIGRHQRFRLQGYKQLRQRRLSIGTAFAFSYIRRKEII